MKDRLNNFLAVEKLTPARFADIIGVQPSNISHIISGRNKPGFDFIEKMLKAFPELNAEWLIIGKGKMYKDAVNEQPFFGNIQPDLFSNSPKNVEKQEYNDENIANNIIATMPVLENISQKTDILPEINRQNRDIERVIICYSDKTFEFYFPRE